MKRILITGILLIMSLSLIAQQKADRETYYFSFDGKNYAVVKEMMTWANASAYAVTQGGYLVEINSIEEQLAVYDAIINGAGVPNNYTSISNGGGIAYVWIGATDQHNEGTWLWDGDNNNLGTHFWTGEGQNGASNGSAVNNAYFNWGGTSTGVPKEPDNYNFDQNYGAIGLRGWPSGTTNLGIPGEWNDIIGIVNLYFVIEYNETSNDDVNLPEFNKIKAYPNPTRSSLKFDRADQVKSVDVYNIKGQKIMSTQDKEIDLSPYQKGVYLLKISDGKRIHYQKIMLLE